MNLWVVTEDLKGTQNQCVGVAEALGIKPVIKTIGLNFPWKQLSPYIGFEREGSFSGDALTAPWPDIVIASGRKSIAAARYIKKQSQGRSLVVYIQDPRISPRNFDLVAVPQHDPTRGKNVIVTTATPNRISDTLLEQGRKDFPEFQNYNSPCLAVLIGGVSQAYDFSLERAHIIAAQLKNFLETTDGSLLITASRRTPPHIALVLQEALKGPQTFFWDGKGDNPYFGFMGHADAIAVTSDSASMLSEAATTGKPVYMIPLDARSSKKTRLVQMQENLMKAGTVKLFDGSYAKWAYEPLKDAQLVANAIEKKLAQ